MQLAKGGAADRPGSMTRLNPVYAAMGTTIFEAMSALCRETGAINLGQGFPDDNGPPELIAAARRALAEKSNQYPPSAGLAELRDGARPRPSPLPCWLSSIPVTR